MTKKQLKRMLQAERTRKRRREPKAEPVKLAVVQGGKAPLKIRQDVLARARQSTRPKLDRMPPVADRFKVYMPPPGVVPSEFKNQIAMDESIDAAMAWAAQSTYQGAWAEGLTFFGYAYLSELAQRPEYRVISSVIATEMTRKWITLQATSIPGADEDKTDKITQLTDELDRLHARDAFYKVAELDGFMGRSHLFLDIAGPDGKSSADNVEELKTPIGNGRDEASGVKVQVGQLHRISAIEPVWCYPANYNSNNPLRADWYNPEMWFVMGKQVHATRLLTFIGRPVPDMLKPAFSFGGLSMTQIAKPYVDNWLTTRQSVNDLIKAFSVMVLATDMSSQLSQSDANGEGSGLFTRVDLFNLLRDNRGTFVINKDTEEFKNVTTPLSSLDLLQAQAQEHMASISRIPLVKLLGTSPAGLNASSEGEIRAFYDTIHAQQEMFFRKNLTKVVDFAMLNLWGEVDQGISIKFEPLWALDEKSMAEVRKTEAETDDILINGCGSLAPEESRKRVAADPDTPYASLDVDDMPEPPEDPSINLKGTEAFGGGPASEGGPGAVELGGEEK